MPKNNHHHKVIVTGATGFIGRHLIPLLINKKYKVIAIVRDIEKSKNFDWFKDVHFKQLDFYKDTLNLEEYNNHGLIHLAWEGLPNYKDNFHYEVNLQRDYEFIKSMIKNGVSQVFISGSCAEYGMQNGAISSSANTYPNTSYAIAKDSLRKFLQLLSNESPYTLQWARLFYMYGEGQNPNSILAQLDSAIDKKMTKFNMSGGEQIRDYMHVEDVAKSILKIYESKKDGVFNICSGKPITIKNLVEQHIKKRGAKIELNLGHYPYTDFEPHEFWGIPDIKS
jgi:dTDP-6-deoxy-L-talose 4-dehydrogenase (NAD+)